MSNNFLMTKGRSRLFSLISGLLVGLAVGHINFVLAWVCFIPFFIAINRSTLKETVALAVFLGLGMSVIGFYWMIPGSQRFTGSSMAFGFIAAVISAVILCAYWALLTGCFVFLKWDNDRRNSRLTNGVLIASLCVIFEFCLSHFTAGFPWLAYTTSYALSGSLAAIQPVSVFGIYIVTFIVILVNYLLAGCIVTQQWKRLIWPAGFAVIYLCSGYFILNYYNKNQSNAKPVSVAILIDNVPPEVKWDDKNGNALVKLILKQNRKAVTLKPDIALWSESAIPWTYRADDDLVKEVLKITAPANITHIIGINTDYAENVVYNSVYCISPDSKVTGRYDKRFLLNFIEKPLSAFIIPFYSSSGYIVNPGTNNAPLTTPYGKAGIMICNESAVPAAATGMVKNGAEFLFNSSNDGWFHNTYIVKQHLYNTRLRAVETRKDIVVNSNYGLSGLIKSSGELEVFEQSDLSSVEKVFVTPNSYTSLAVSTPFLLIGFSILYASFFLIIKIPFFKTKTQTT